MNRGIREIRGIPKPAGFLSASSASSAVIASAAAPPCWDSCDSSRLSGLGLVLQTGRPGGQVGAYRHVRKLGKGGCSIVNLAGPTEPLRRRVAHEEAHDERGRHAFEKILLDTAFALW